MEDAPINPDALRNDGECDSEVLEGLLAKIGLLLALENTEERVAVLNALEVAAREYVLFKSIVPLYGTPKQQKRVIGQLIEALDKVLWLLDGIAPEYQVTINGMIDRETSDRFAMPDAKTRIWKIRDAAAMFP